VNPALELDVLRLGEAADDVGAVLERCHECVAEQGRELREERDASVVAVVTGSRASIPVLRLAAEQFPTGMRVVSIRARLDVGSSYRPAGMTTVVDVGRLDDLERLLSSAGGL